MEALGTATLTHEIPAHRGVTTIVSREAITDALRESAPELYLDLERGDERSTISISWSHDELEQLLDRASGDDILFTFDRDQLELAFDDVEAHGFRERALVFTVAVAGALGSSAAIANAAPIIERGSDGAASIAAVQALATNSAPEFTSNVHTPGLQPVDDGSMAAAASVKLAKEPQPPVSDVTVSNVHRPGLQLGPGESAPATNSATEFTSNVHTPGLQPVDDGSMAAAASVKLAKEPQPPVSDVTLSNVHRPGMQLEPGDAAVSTPSISVKATGNGSDSEFLGVNTQDVTDALIAGGVLLAIAGATFAGTRRPGSARPA
jgi:hypothetical protein